MNFLRNEEPTYSVSQNYVYIEVVRWYISRSRTSFKAQGSPLNFYANKPIRSKSKIACTLLTLLQSYCR